jgi:DNA-binding NarL/FixJ family response regulator
MTVLEDVPTVAMVADQPMLRVGMEKTVAMVADQPMFRAGVEKLVSDDPALTLVATVEDPETLLAMPGGYDVVILDLPSRGDQYPVDVIRRISALGAPLVYGSWDRPAHLLAAVRAGARGCVTRQTERSSIHAALRVVAAGGLYLCRRLVGPFQAELARPGEENTNALAPREVETLRWIAMGFTHAQIATRMGLSHATVNTYVKRIRTKLNVTNKADLTRMAIELGHLYPNNPA